MEVPVIRCASQAAELDALPIYFGCRDSDCFIINWPLTSALQIHFLDQSRCSKCCLLSIICASLSHIVSEQKENQNAVDYQGQTGRV